VNVQGPTPIDRFWLMQNQLLGNIEAKQILYFIFSAPCPKIVPAPLRELIFVDATNKFSFFEEKEYCLQHNVLRYDS